MENSGRSPKTNQLPSNRSLEEEAACQVPVISLRPLLTSISYEVRRRVTREPELTVPREIPIQRSKVIGRVPDKHGKMRPGVAPFQHSQGRPGSSKAFLEGIPEAVAPPGGRSSQNRLNPNHNGSLWSPLYGTWKVTPHPKGGDRDPAHRWSHKPHRSGRPTDRGLQSETSRLRHPLPRSSSCRPHRHPNKRFSDVGSWVLLCGRYPNAGIHPGECAREVF